MCRCRPEEVQCETGMRFDEYEMEARLEGAGEISVVAPREHLSRRSPNPRGLTGATFEGPFSAVLCQE